MDDNKVDRLLSDVAKVQSKLMDDLKVANTRADTAEAKLRESEAKCGEMRKIIEVDIQRICYDVKQYGVLGQMLQTAIDKALSTSCGQGWHSPADWDALVKDHDKEIGDFQEEVRNLVIKLTGASDGDIDGKGSDAGWQEFTLAEISQGIAFVIDQREVLASQCQQLREALVGLLEKLRSKAASSLPVDPVADFATQTLIEIGCPVAAPIDRYINDISFTPPTGLVSVGELEPTIELVEELRLAVMYDPYNEDERCATSASDLPLVRKADKELARLERLKEGK